MAFLNDVWALELDNPELPSESSSESSSESISESSSESASTSQADGYVYWDHVETNRPQTDLVNTIITDCTFDSTGPTDLLPDYFDAENFNESDFIYSTFGFANTGSGSSEWSANGYNYGILGTLRAGIGFFYFYTSIPYTTDEILTGDDGCAVTDFSKIKFWDYISTFWNFLDDDSREMVENLWYGMTIAAGTLAKKASRFLTSIAPTTADVCVFDDYYDIEIGPLLSRPVFLDPTVKSPKSIINAIGTVLVEPTYDSDNNPVYRDLIEISGDDYQKIRNLGERLSASEKIISSCYVVVQPKDTDIDTKYFPVTDFLSSNEAKDRVASAEINRTLEDSPNENAGTLKIICLDYTEDVSQYKVSIIHDAGLATAAEIAWTSNSLEITVNNGHADPIDDIENPASVTGSPWATISDISAPSKVQAPVFTNIDFEDLYNYIGNQEGVGRYYQDSGKVWRWYEGWSSDNGTIGTISQGEYTDSKSKFKYLIEVSGSLAYLEAEEFSIYLTTGKSYNVTNEVINLPYLSTGIEEDGIYFRKDVDYTFEKYIEFLKDPFVYEGIDAGDVLYCKHTPVIENYLFTQHGGMVGISDWTQYNYNNISGKAALNTLQSSLRNSSDLAEYEKALNVYYGLPVAPEKSRVIGLFESFGYKITAISGLTVTLEIKDGEELHPFIQRQCSLINDAGKGFVINGVSSDRTLGRITLQSNDYIEDLYIGDRLYVRLNNRFRIKNIYPATSTTPPYIDVYIREGELPVKHVIDTVYNISYGKIKYPELIIHGTGDYDGLYHATAIETAPGSTGSVFRISLYSPDEDEDPVYNDYIGPQYQSELGGTFNNPDLYNGYAHLPWPTPKFLYLYMINEERYYRAYMDAPMDTVYDNGDILDQYQIICRNASPLNSGLFGYWNQYKNFRKSPGINVDLDLVEFIFADPSAKFGQYFPSGYLA